VPVLLNTSFNLRGEPIVADAFDALWCFVRAGLDAVVIGDVLISRSAVPETWRRWGEEVPRGQRPMVSDNVYTFF